MDWQRIGRALVRMELDSLQLVAESPQFDRRYFEQAETLYTRWLAESREAGVVAPTLTLAGAMWLGGIAGARLLPRRWRRLLVLLTLAFIARQFAVAGRDEAAA